MGLVFAPTRTAYVHSLPEWAFARDFLPEVPTGNTGYPTTRAQPYSVHYKFQVPEIMFQGETTCTS